MIKEKFEAHEELSAQGKLAQENFDDDAKIFGVLLKNDWNCIGTAYIYLEALGNLLEIKNDCTPLIDNKGVKNGELRYSMVPKYFENKREQNLLEFNSVEDLEAK